MTHYLFYVKIVLDKRLSDNQPPGIKQRLQEVTEETHPHEQVANFSLVYINFGWT